MNMADTIPLLLLLVVVSVFGLVFFMVWLVANLNRRRQLAALELTTVDSETKKAPPMILLPIWVKPRRFGRNKRLSHHATVRSVCRRSPGGRNHLVQAQRQPGSVRRRG